MSTQTSGPPRFALQFNKVAAKLAGKRFFPLWALVRHRGRKSGKPYETPVAIVASVGDRVYIALPWGRKSDWVRNLQAGGGGFVWKGRTFDVQPTLVGKDEVLGVAAAFQRFAARRAGWDDFLRLTLTPTV